ncbi:MAG: sigma-70 family RNA polymerase sigma factor [Planctomycetota bacterium]|nr:sigma-70 family RNA polymerase sigma factor [Planctomycetota bacterium]
MDTRSARAGGDVDAGPPEVVAHGAALRSLARALVGEQHADDAVQETWLRYLERRPATGTGLGGWLATVLRRLVSNERRADERRAQRERDGARPEVLDEPTLREREELLRSVVDAVLTLEPAYREVVMLRWFEGLPPRDIARRLGLEPNVVHTRLSRAHAKLREKLDRELGTRKALSGLFALGGLKPSILTLGPLAGTGAVLVASKLALASGVAAVVLCGALWFALSGSGDGEPALAQARAELAAEPGSVEFANGPKPPSDTAQERSEAPTTAARVEEAVTTPWDAPAFEYELDVAIVDSLDLPRDQQAVYAAPAGHTLNEVGSTGDDGHLLLRWRGFQPSMELDLTLDASGNGRRLRVSAGSQRVALRTNSSRVAEAIRASLTFEVVVSGRNVRTIGDFFTTVEGSSIATCQRDPDGRIQWVEPALCDVSVSELAHGELVEIDSSVEGVGVFRGEVINFFAEPAATPGTGRVVGLVLDHEGKPVENAAVVAWREGTQHRPSTRTDAQGRFELADLAPADWTIAAGGGDHGRARTLATLAAGSTFRWEPQLDRGLELKGRLVGPTGVALADWVVEVECDDPLEPLVDATKTNAEGRFAIPNLPPRSLRVLARPSDRSRSFANVVFSGVFPGESELELVSTLAEPDKTGSITASVSDADGRDPRVVRAIAWRADTQRGTPGECISTASQVESSDGGKSEVLPGPTEISIEGLGSGWHTLEIAFRGRAPLIVPRLRCEPDQPVELGALLAPEPALLELGGPQGSSASCSLVHRGATVELRCEFESPANATLRLRDGEYLFTRKLGDASVSRRLLVEPGTTTSF